MNDIAQHGLEPGTTMATRTRSRRSFVRFAFICGVGLLLAIAACGDDDDDGGPPPPLDIDDAVWTHSSPIPTVDCRFSDPINLRFLGTTVAQIISQLKSAPATPNGEKWRVSNLEPSTQFLVSGGTCTHGHSVDVVAGDPFKPFEPRYHLRLWDLGDQGIVGAVHVDIPALSVHQSVEFEHAEGVVAQAFSEASGVTVSEDAVDLRNATQLPFNDGRATTVQY